MDTLALSSQELDYSIWDPIWKETLLEGEPYFVSNPLSIPNSGSLSEITGGFQPITHYRLGREKIWMKNLPILFLGESIVLHLCTLPVWDRRSGTQRPSYLRWRLVPGFFSLYLTGDHKTEVILVRVLKKNTRFMTLDNLLLKPVNRASHRFVSP